MHKYHYIITGMGASGLMLAYHLCNDAFFKDKNILLIDRELKNKNDRTWCFWEKETSSWEPIISQQWDSIYFGSEGFSEQIEILPYRYKMIKGKDFYDFVLTTLERSSNITITTEELVSLRDDGEKAQVITNHHTYVCDKVFNSVVLSSDYKNHKKYPLLNQHFVGWFVKTKKEVFDNKTATFMDFTVPQLGNTRFMYVLPTSTTEALLEYTLFSEKLLPEGEYEDAIKEYLQQKGIEAYEIVEKEKGCIPMTSYPFANKNSKNILHMGTAGGWTKPSTGYTFHICTKKINKLVQFLKKNEHLSQFERKTRFWYYDLLFLDVLYKDNGFGHVLFSTLFKKNSSQKILKFLDEETTVVEELKITTSLPKSRFLKALWSRIF